MSFVKEKDSILTNLSISVRLKNNIRKAMTEKSSLRESSRESDRWWKSLMRKTDENHSRAAVLKKVGAAVCLR